MSDNDIRRIIKIKYPGFYDLRFTQNTLDCGDNQGLISKNYQNSTKGLAVIGTRELSDELNKFKSSVKNRSSSSIISRTFIINISNFHWVTLVVVYQNNRYFGFYIDSLGSEIHSNIKENLETKNITYQDFNKSKYPNICRQTDSYNCGLWALENAEDINEVIRGFEAKTISDVDLINQIKSKMERESRKRNKSYFINQRKELIEKLKRNNSSGEKRTLPEIDKQNNSSKKLKIDRFGGSRKYIGEEETLQASLYGASNDSNICNGSASFLNDSGMGDELEHSREEEVDDPEDESNDSGTGSDSEDELNVNFADNETYTLDYQEGFDSPEQAGRLSRESGFVNDSDDEDESNCTQESLATEMSRRKRTNPFIDNEFSTLTKKRHDDSTSPLLTLKSETKKGNYTYCLQEKDIINVARVMYSDLYDNGLVVISNSDKPRNNTVKVFRYFNEEELERQILHFIATVVNKKSNDLLILQTLIIELEKDQWVTLVLCYCNEKYTAYCVNSLKGAGGGISNFCIDKLLSHRSIKHAENFDLKISQCIQLVGKSSEQLPKHNCSWLALENARDIYKVLKESGTSSQEVNSEIIKQLKVRRDENYFKDLRKQFSNRQSREPAGKLPKHLSDGSNNLDEEELNEIRSNTLSNSYCESRIFGIMYQVQFSVLCFINLFRLNKGKYPKCRLSVEQKQYYPFDDLVLFDGKKNTCIQVKCKSELEGFRGYHNIQFNHLFPKNRRYGRFSVYNYLEELIKNKSLDIDKDDIQNFVIYTDADFDFDKNKLEVGRYELSKPKSYLGSDFFPVKFDKIDFQKHKEFEFLKDCLCPDGLVDGASFYQFSQDKKTEKAFLEYLSSGSNCSKRKKEIIKKLYKKMVFAVRQPSLDKTFENVRKTTIKVMEKDRVSKHSIDEEEVEKTCMELEEAMLDYCANPIGTYIANKNQETFESGIKHTKEYEKLVSLINVIPAIKFQINILLHSLLRVLGNHPLSENLYFAFCQRKNIFNTIHFRYADKNTYVITKQAKEKNLLIGFKKLFYTYSANQSFNLKKIV